MKTKKGFVILLVTFVVWVLASALLYWLVETQKSDYEYVDTKGEKHIAKYCDTNSSKYREVKPSCTLKDGTVVFDVVSYKKLVDNKD